MDEILRQDSLMRIASANRLLLHFLLLLICSAVVSCFPTLTLQEGSADQNLKVLSATRMADGAAVIKLFLKRDLPKDQATKAVLDFVKNSLMKDEKLQRAYVFFYRTESVQAGVSAKITAEWSRDKKGYNKKGTHNKVLIIRFIGKKQEEESFDTL